MHPRRNRCFCLILILCMSTVACASLVRNYGRIDPNAEVTKAFEGYQVNPQYRYYISGPDSNPNAIMALDRGYQLDPTTLWREVDMSPAVMKEFIRGMKAKVFENQSSLYGFEMSDNNGRTIGVWYSILQARTSLRVNANGTVRIDTPPLETYEIRNGNPIRDHHMGSGVPNRY